MLGRILVVDDNVALAENIAEVFEFEGFHPLVAASAEQALALTLARDLAAVITDLRLPGLDGAELVARLRPGREQVRFAVISRPRNVVPVRTPAANPNKARGLCSSRLSGRSAPTKPAHPSATMATAT